MGEGMVTYSIPEGLKGKVFVGQVVEIPLRERREFAVVRFLRSDDPGFPTKKIGSIITPVLFSDFHFCFLERLAKESFLSLGRLFSLFLPRKILQTSGIAPREKIFILQKSDFSGNGKKLQEAFRVFLDHGEVQSEAFLKHSGISLSTLRTLQKKGILSEESREEDFFQGNSIPLRDIAFSASEEFVLDDIRISQKTLLIGSSLSQRNRFSFQRMLDILKERKTIHFLVPETLLLARLSEKFKNLFGEDSVLEVHAGLSENVRRKVWWKVKKGFSGIVIGTRAALFLPFENLGLIVGEDPHESAFKSSTPPLYHAAFAAEILSEVFKVPLLFQTNVPDVAFMHTSSEKKWKKIFFEEPVSAPLYIVDMKKEKAFSKTIFSEPLEAAISNTLGRKKNVLLYLNRRGLFPGVLCSQCGFSPKCPRDHTTLVLHRDVGKNFLLCHTCGYSEAFSGGCPKCKKSSLREFGIGTQRVEMEAALLFPEAKIFRIDKDTTPSVRILKEKIEDFQSGEGNILIGTKGMIRAISPYSIETLGIILAETDLSFPDFRASEKAFSTFFHLFEKTERSEYSKIFLQTYIPDHFFMKEVMTRRYKDFFSRELALRKMLFLPPFSELVKIEYSGNNQITLLKKGEREKKKYEELSKSLFPNTSFSCSLFPLHSNSRGQKRILLFLLGENTKELLWHSPPKNAVVDISPEEYEEAFSFSEYPV